MAATFVGLLVLWRAGVLSWKNPVNDTGAWQTLVFFSVLVGLASQLSLLRRS